MSIGRESRPLPICHRNSKDRLILHTDAKTENVIFLGKAVTPTKIYVGRIYVSSYPQILWIIKQFRSEKSSLKPSD